MLALVALSLLTTVAAQPQCLCLDEVMAMRDSRSPLVFRYSSPTDQRRFIAEQYGMVWIVNPDGTRLSEPFLNLSAYVESGDFYGDERGFLQLEFHPNFASNGLLYAYFSIADYDFGENTTLVEFSVEQNNPNKVNISSGRILINIEQPFFNHNGGDLIFGADNYLYLFTGDGGFGGDPDNNAQDMSSLLGKAIRIDVNRRTYPPRNPQYGIPPDNPYLDDPDARPELYAIGLRNPWRVGYDRDYQGSDTYLPHGRMFIADVGQNWAEEVNLLWRGVNYEWSCREGLTLYDRERCDDEIAGTVENAKKPNHVYNHLGESGRSITGGHVYRGVQNRATMTGLYFFADYVTSEIWYMNADQGANNTAWSVTRIYTCNDPDYPARSTVCEQNGMTGDMQSYRSILSFGEDNNKELYMLSTNNPNPTNEGGRVWKLVDPSTF